MNTAAEFVVRVLKFEELTFIWFVIGTLLFVLAIYIYDRCQKGRAILRNYPVIGHLRYFFIWLGVYARQYFFSTDREELPFNRAERTWVGEASRDVEPIASFGSTRDIKPTGSVFFVDAPFPTLYRDAVKTSPIIIGPYCRAPYSTPAIFNISAMSYGAISKNAVRALSQGAKLANCWLNTGEGGVSPYHLESGCDVVAQIGTAKYGFCDANGLLSTERLQKFAAMPQIKMFELKISQGAKPGKGGILPAAKVTKEISEIRNIKMHTDSISPNRHPEISNCTELLTMLNHIREVTGKPVGFKIVLGSYEWLDDLFSEIHRIGIEHAPDFISLDGAEGGTGAAPMTLMDYMGLPILESLPVLIDMLVEYNLRDRIKVNAAGKLITSAEVAWALCVGADFVSSARGFMFSLGCIQALRCHTNKCPTGIATHKPNYMKGLDPENKAVRVSNYARRIQYEVGMIGHSCGVHEPRELKRSHARIVTNLGTSVSLAELYPDKVAGSKLRVINT